MESGSDNAPLIAIVGETASGKSALALELARRFNGEIIAADSRTIYKGLDIGTAKPTPKERQAVRHHLLDVVTPDGTFTVADFKRMANEAMADIARRGKLAFLVGGTGLYIDAVIYDFSFRGVAHDPAMRNELQQLDVDDLQALILERNLAMPANSRNPRHLIRVLEADGILPERHPLRQNTLIIGLEIERDVLRTNIAHRVEQMVGQGFIDEVRSTMAQYGQDAPALQAPGYKAFRAYLDNEIDLETAKQQFVQNDMRLAKRQRTWFRRNEDINWICKKAEAVDLVTTFLNK